MEVRDTGIGIPESEQERIFDAFAQADSSTSRRFGGTGMGLTICRQIIEQQGGEIGVRSAEGVGSSFWIELTFPIGDKPGDQDAVAELKAVALSKLRVLVVDDVAINQQLTEGQLRSQSHSVVLAANGEEAFAQVQKEHVDLVLMDLHMPVMDGLEATRLIRGLPDRSRAAVPVIGVTANISPEGEQDCPGQRYGYGDYQAHRLQHPAYHIAESPLQAATGSGRAQCR